MRYIYRGALARPLRPGERAEDKLPDLLADLGVSPGDYDTALLRLGPRHISGLRKSGPRTRRYSGPLRQLLKQHEKAEDKVPLLMSHYGVSTHRTCLMAVARVHVPGLRLISPGRTGGPTRKTRRASEQIIKKEEAKWIKRGPEAFARPKNIPMSELKTLARNYAAQREHSRAHEVDHFEADVREAWLCEIFDFLRSTTGASRKAIAKELSELEPESGYDNPGYGLDPSYIIERWKKQKRYERAARERLERRLLKFNRQYCTASRVPSKTRK